MIRPDFLRFDPAASAAVRRFFAADVAEFVSQLTALESEIENERATSDDNLLQRIADLLQQSQDSCRQIEREFGGDPHAVRELQTQFRLDTSHVFERSWFGHHARTKPSGFPGDYQMLLALYDGRTPARGFGAYLDRCLGELPLARAVRARLQATKNFLLEEVAARRGPVCIMDIACGPCREYLNWNHTSAAEIHVVCIDNDERALRYVDEMVAPTATGLRLQTVRYNALRTRSAKKNIELFGRVDVLYSAGLCDYLTDDTLIPMLSGWWDTLADGGVLYVAFKDAELYDKTPYQWHLDWHFYQRTQDDCWRLFREAGFDLPAMEMTRDATGIIMNFISRARLGTGTRIDQKTDSRISAPHIANQAPVEP